MTGKVVYYYWLALAGLNALCALVYAAAGSWYCWPATAMAVICRVVAACVRRRGRL